ncbi:MAG: energy-coupling factor ABC transporter permease [Ardenticatenales bacterium]|nr:energy-coupling factor ABC transporter permease [Ardenticatenales bacterium]
MRFLLFWAITILFVVLATRRAWHDVGERQIPLVGVLAAAIFAAQINFPVAGVGTSGHMLGRAMTSRPWAAILAMTAVVAAGAVFQDGGGLQLANHIFNSILTAIIGYGFTAWRRARQGAALRGGRAGGMGLWSWRRRCSLAANLPAATPTPP